MSAGLFDRRIWVSDEIAVDDIGTLKACDEALEYLTSTIAGIENQLEIHTDPAPGQTQAEFERWRRNAKAALRYKNAAKTIVTKRRAEMTRQENLAAIERAKKEREERRRQHEARVAADRQAAEQRNSQTGDTPWDRDRALLKEIKTIAPDVFYTAVANLAKARKS